MLTDEPVMLWLPRIPYVPTAGTYAVGGNGTQELVGAEAWYCPSAIPYNFYKEN